MQVALRASVLSLGIKAKYRVGFSKNRTKEGQWLFTNKHLPNTDSIHVLDNMADFARYIGVPFTTPVWNIPLTAEDNSVAEQYIHQPTLVISPAASKDERNWLAEHYAAIADYAVTKGLAVILCGSPSKREQQLGQQISSYSQTPITNLIGKTTLLQLTALLRAATVVIAPDSGLGTSSHDPKHASDWIIWPQ